MPIAFNMQAVREEDFGFALGNVRRAVQMGLVDPELGTLGKQGQLLAEHCMRLTPPKSAAQGRKRVQRDLEKIFHPVDPAGLDSPSLRKLVYRGDAPGWEAFARNVRKGPLAGTVAVTPDAALHQANRDSRGRARRTNMVTLWPQRGALKALINAAKERVGWGKGGWLRGYLALGGRRAPDWVLRHGAVRGVFVDGRSAERPAIEVRNDTGWGRSGESQRIVGNALAARARAMQRYFDTMMGLAAKGINTPWQTLRAQMAAQFDAAA